MGLIVESPDQVMAITRELYDTLGDRVKLIEVVPLLRVLKWRQFPGGAPAAGLS